MSTLLSDGYPITFRFLSSEDIPEAMSLCKESFPKEYAEEYFVHACANPEEFFIFGCFDAIYDIETSEWHDPAMPIEEEQLLRENDFQMSYVCLIAVKSARKSGGIGSFLMQQFIYRLKKRALPPNAIYLHVLSANQRAIDFYKNINFKVFCHLPSYYNYNGQHHDALILVQSFHNSVEVFPQPHCKNRASFLSAAQNPSAIIHQEKDSSNDQKQKRFSFFQKKTRCCSLMLICALCSILPFVQLYSKTMLL